MNIVFKILLLTIILSSCRINRQNIIGIYELKGFKKTTLTLNEDNTFTFTQNYPNPYIHPFPHPDEYYFKTLGEWALNNGIILLTGTEDSLIYETVEVKSTDTSKEAESRIEFIDEYGDIVPILFVQYQDSSTVYALHHKMNNFHEDLSKQDTLRFYFFGYAPWTLINGDGFNRNYIVELKPEFRTQELDSLYLKLRKNSIGSGKLKFIKGKKTNGLRF